MEVTQVVTGFLEANCYVIKKDDKALVVDPGDDYHLIKEAIGDTKVAAVLITHSHSDHVGALRNFLTTKSMKIFKFSNTEEGKVYGIDGFSFEVIFAPGHSKDSIIFYFKESKEMFVGDFIFKDSIGRCDLPGGSEHEMFKSLSMIKHYPDDITVYPGHREISSLGREKEYNPFFQMEK